MVGLVTLLGGVLAATRAPAPAHAKAVTARPVRLETAASVAARGRELHKRGMRQLARGFASLALHLDPYLALEGGKEAKFVHEMLKGEKTDYWEGNLFIGLDKTYIEAVVGMPNVSRSAIYVWRGLQLTGLSCCGIDNFVVSLQQASRHLYIIPFMNLVPGYHESLQPANRGMYASFFKWWSETGRRPMPDPPITHSGKGHFDWSVMRVALPRRRVPRGWTELTQAVLLYHLSLYAEAHACALNAMTWNANLTMFIRELMPGLQGLTAPTGGRATSAHATAAASALAEEGGDSWWNWGRSNAPPASPMPQADVAGHVGATKYLICYNPHVGLGNLAVVITSAYALAQLSGRRFVLHWNANSVSQYAFRLREEAGARLLSDAAPELGIVPSSAKDLLMFHTTHGNRLAESLEFVGCADLRKAWQEPKVLTVTSNLYFAPLLATNPHTPAGAVAEFPELLSRLLAPSDEAVQRALSYASEQQWGTAAPVVAIHVRAREAGEDNDDWPTAAVPDAALVDNLRRCTEAAVQRELGNVGKFDVYIAATTEKARAAVESELRRKAPGVRSVLRLPNLERNRQSGLGAVDAMAEALLISRADVYVRLVIGTAGSSTFATLANALRFQSDWTSSMPSLRREPAYMPNYVVTDRCGADRCYEALAQARMADVGWQGEGVTRRSCGDVMQRVEKSNPAQQVCPSLRSVHGQRRGVEEL